MDAISTPASTQRRDENGNALCKKVIEKKGLCRRPALAGGEWCYGHWEKKDTAPSIPRYDQHNALLCIWKDVKGSWCNVKAKKGDVFCSKHQKEENTPQEQRASLGTDRYNKGGSLLCVSQTAKNTECNITASEGQTMCHIHCSKDESSTQQYPESISKAQEQTTPENSELWKNNRQYKVRGMGNIEINKGRSASQPDEIQDQHPTYAMNVVHDNKEEQRPKQNPLMVTPGLRQQKELNAQYHASESSQNVAQPSLETPSHEVAHNENQYYIEKRRTDTTPQELSITSSTSLHTPGQSLGTSSHSFTRAPSNPLLLVSSPQLRKRQSSNELLNTEQGNKKPKTQVSDAVIFRHTRDSPSKYSKAGDASELSKQTNVPHTQSFIPSVSQENLARWPSIVHGQFNQPECNSVEPAMNPPAQPVPNLQQRQEDHQRNFQEQGPNIEEPQNMLYGQNKESQKLQKRQKVISTITDEVTAALIEKIAQKKKEIDDFKIEALKVVDARMTAQGSQLQEKYTKQNESFSEMQQEISGLHKTNAILMDECTKWRNNFTEMKEKQDELLADMHEEYSTIIRNTKSFFRKSLNDEITKVRDRFKDDLADAQQQIDTLRGEVNDLKSIQVQHTNELAKRQQEINIIQQSEPMQNIKPRLQKSIADAIKTSNEHMEAKLSQNKEDIVEIKTKLNKICQEVEQLKPTKSNPSRDVSDLHEILKLPRDALSPYQYLAKSDVEKFEKKSDDNNNQQIPVEKKPEHQHKKPEPQEQEHYNMFNKPDQQSKIKKTFLQMFTENVIDWRWESL